MTDVDVTVAGDEVTVQVTQAGAATRHRVRVTDAMLERLGVAGADRERVVRASFGFLLEREPATSILADFELTDITRYFPEYEREIRARVGG